MKQLSLLGSFASFDLDPEIALKTSELCALVSELSLENKINAINNIKTELHKVSPFASEPVDCVLWVPNDQVKANDYNPNVVAPPEMELLRVSIDKDGYTQPIVTWNNPESEHEVVDGFHRTRVGKECKSVKERVKNHLPLVVVNEDRQEKGDRIAATIRHNRARGRHHVEGMSDIVLELKNRNWTNERIAKNLGMDEDEILRLCQITGLADLFKDQEFSKSWDIEDSEPDFEELSDDPMEIENQKEKHGFRTVNTGDGSRIFHTYEKWECYSAGLYATTKDGMSKEACEKAYAEFLSNDDLFSQALDVVTSEWKYSCEHYLTNSSMNRIAWLGQAAMCQSTGIPAVFRSGFNLLSEPEQKHANEVALVYLNRWLKANGLKEVSLEEGLSGKQMDLY